MEFAGFMKIAILVFALLVPVVIVISVYKTLFSGLRSIPASKKQANAANDETMPEQTQNQKQAETEVDH